MPNASSLSIAVPCYNEEKNIPLIVGRFTEALTRYKGHARIEILLVDNGSRDGTAAAMEREFSVSKYKDIFRRVHVVDNKGYGFGILSGLKEAKGEVLAWTHADMQTDPYDVFKAFELFVSDKETLDPAKLLIKGRRVGRKFGDWAFTCGMSVISSVILGAWLHDINAQPKLFHRSLFESMKDPPYDFSLDLFLVYLAKRRGIRVRLIDVVFLPRIHGESKWAFNWRSKYKTILRTIRYIVALRQDLALKGDAV
jgi:glycosyltransferase involved in cell wall biosynthesis